MIDKHIGFFIKGFFQYYHLVKPLINGLPKGVKITIFHINRNGTHAPVDENVCLVNLASKLNVYKELELQSLDYLVFFNPGQIFDFFLVVLCRQLDISTIYYQHGLSLDFGSFNIKNISQGRKFHAKLLTIKNYSFYYKSIIINILRNKNWSRNLIYIILRSKQVFFHYGKKDFPKYGLKQFHCDFAIVYGRYDERYLIEKNGFAPDQIYIGGYKMEEDEKEWEFGLSDYVLYISSGLMVSNVIPNSRIIEQDFYQMIAKAVKTIGKTLIIKLHPKEDISTFNNYIKGLDNVYIYKNINLSNLVKAASITIGDYSTALFYSIIHKKPLVLLQSEYLEKYPFDFSDFGIGVKATLENLQDVLSADIRIDNIKYDEFMKEYVKGDQNSLSLILSLPQKNKIEDVNRR